MVWVNLKEVENLVKNNKISKNQGKIYLFLVVVLTTVVLSIVPTNESLKVSTVASFIGLGISMCFLIILLQRLYRVSKKITCDNKIGLISIICWVVGLRMFVTTIVVCVPILFTIGLLFPITVYGDKTSLMADILVTIIQALYWFWYMFYVLRLLKKNSL